MSVTAKTKIKTKRKTKAKQTWIYSPEGFNVADHDLPPALENEIRWLLSTVYYYRATALRRDQDDAFVALSSRVLANVYGDKSKVRVVREACVRAGLVEVDNHYVVGEKAIGHRLGPALRGRKFRRWDGDGGKVFLNRFARFKEEWTATEGLDELGVYLRYWCLRVKVGKGVEAAFEGMSGEKRNLAENQVEMLKQGMIRTKFCEYGRFHSNFTRLCSEVRPYLEIDGKRLHEIDLVGSQTLFLADLLQSEREDFYSPPSYSTSPPSPSPSSLPYDPVFSSSFHSSVTAGTVYEEFQRHHEFASRGEAKEEFFHAVYGSPRATRAFREVWPQEGEILRRLKVKHGYKWVPQEMQRRESHIFLRVAVDRLRREHPEVPVVTVHDSVLTTEEHLPLVERILREAFADFSYQPRLRIQGEVR